MGQGTNNGGGARWADMERGTCPKCGLTRPVGVSQHERRFLCNNSTRCRARADRKAIREARQHLNKSKT